MRSDAPGERTTIGRTAGWLWLFMGVAVLVGVLAPAAGEVHVRTAVAVAAFGIVVGVVSLTAPVPWERVPMWQHAAGALITPPAITVVLWATGGVHSYALPFLCLPMLFTAFFFSWRWVAAVVGLSLVALASPFAYDAAAVDGGYLPVYFAVALTCVVLAAVTLRLRGRLVAAEKTQRAIALTDALTGIANRRAFDFVLDREVAAARPGQAEPTALVLLDLDHFKRVNDLHGHPAGDAVLRRVARECAGVIRPSEHWCRIGGDEFAVVAPRAGAAGAERLAADLLDRVSQPPDGAGLQVSATVAWSLVGPDGYDMATVMAAADRRLHAAKDARGQVPAPGADASHL